MHFRHESATTPCDAFSTRTSPLVFRSRKGKKVSRKREEQTKCHIPEPLVVVMLKIVFCKFSGHRSGAQNQEQEQFGQILHFEKIFVVLLSVRHFSRVVSEKRNRKQLSSVTADRRCRQRLISVHAKASSLSTVDTVDTSATLDEFRGRSLLFSLGEFNRGLL